MVLKCLIKKNFLMTPDDVKLLSRNSNSPQNRPSSGNVNSQNSKQTKKLFPLVTAINIKMEILQLQ